MSGPLATYLNEHLGGAQLAVRILEAMCNLQDERHYREFARRLLPQVQSDHQVLYLVVAAVGSDPGHIKNASGWLPEKLARLKLGHTTPTSMEIFETLEMLSLGIAGKLALWKALQAAASSDERLHRFDFEDLIERAQQQFQTIEEQRVRLAGFVFSAKAQAA